MAWVTQRKSRRKQRDGTFRITRSKFYVIRYYDAEGKRLEVTTKYTDRKSAEQAAARLERELAQGGEGLVDRFKAHRSRPLSSHLADYLADLRTAGKSDKYQENVKNRLSRLFEESGWKVPADVSADGFTTWRSSQGEQKSAETLNQYGEMLSALLNWMAGKGRIERNPLLHPNTGRALVDKVKGPKRRQRRALSDEESGRILAAALQEDRPILRFAMTTGLRRRELEKLQWGDVKLKAIPPYLQLRAEATKAARADRLPLRQDIANELRELKPEDAADTDRVFPRILTMVDWKATLARAREGWLKEAATDAERVRRAKSDILLYKDRAGRQADFHAGTRKTLCTRMHKAGVPLATAMRIMRHTDARLTLIDYCDEAQLETVQAVESLPPLVESNDSAAFADQPAPGHRAQSA